MEFSVTTYTEDELIAEIRTLTPRRLRAWLRDGLVRPERRKGEAVYDDLDRARIELICLLRDEFEVNDDALEIFVGYLDQLYGMRRELIRLMRAIESQPDDIRNAIIEELKRN